MPPFTAPFPAARPISFQSSSENSENDFSFRFFTTDIQKETPPSTAALTAVAFNPSCKEGFDSS